MLPASFALSLIDHTQAIGGTYNRTRVLRAALLAREENREEKPACVSWRIWDRMSVKELMAALHVRRSGERFVLNPKKPVLDEEVLEATTRQLTFTHEAGGRCAKQRVRMARGQLISKIPWGLIEHPHGETSTYQLNVAAVRGRSDYSIGDALSDAYALFDDDQATYDEVADLWNAVPVLSPTGREWTKDTTRDILYQPAYMGYGRAGSYSSDAPGASSSKRGALTLYPINFTEPLVDLETWCAANRGKLFLHSHEITFTRFRNRADERAWQEQLDLDEEQRQAQTGSGQISYVLGRWQIEQAIARGKAVDLSQSSVRAQYVSAAEALASLGLTSEIYLYHLGIRRGWQPILVEGATWYRRVEVLAEVQRRKAKGK